MAIKTLLLLLLVGTLTQASLGLRPEESPHSQADPRAVYPCPEVADIAPCVCIYDPITYDLVLNCSDIQSDTQLENVFKSYFPFEGYTLLTIIKNPDESRVPITALPSDIFQNVTFDNIYISHTDLSFIYPTAFDKSAPYLKTLIVTDSFLTIFPFDLVDYAPNLTDLRVFRNRLIHMPEMSSDTLTYLHIGYNPGLEYGDHVLQNLPNLEYFVANDNEHSHVAANTFLYNTKLKYLDLSYNHLETLYKDSLKFTSPIQEIKLDSNRIHTVEVGAISGLGAGNPIFLWMQHNQVESLEQSVWEPVFQSVLGISFRTFVFDDNPFMCSCNILWLVDNSGYLDTIARGSICLNTDTDIHDVDYDFLQANC